MATRTSSGIQFPATSPTRTTRTLRAALDHAAPRNPVQLHGNDGHRGAFNSLALASAKNAGDRIVGFSRATLASDFVNYRKLIGTDERGEPNGSVNEDARYAIDAHSVVYNELEKVAKVPAKIPARLNSVGITAILDAQAAPEGLFVYDKLLNSGHMTARATLAQFYDPSRTRTPDGRVDYDGMVAKAKAVRTKYATNPYVRADFVKLFADGVVEANPYAVPPTLGNAATEGHATVTGYVDT